MVKKEEKKELLDLDPTQIGFFSELMKAGILAPFIAKAFSTKCDCEICKQLRELGSKYEEALKNIKTF